MWFKLKNQVKTDRSLKWILLILLVIFSLLIRIAWIDQIPVNLNPDEADTLRTFITMSFQPLWPSIISTNWNGAPAINTYLLGWGWLITGQGFAGIKSSVIVLSTFGVGIFFLAARRFTRSSWLALAVSLCLASDPVFLHFSRSGWENILVAIPVSLTLFLLASSPRNLTQRWQRGLALCLTGVMALYLYHPGKIVFVVNMFLGGIELVRFWRASRFNSRSFKIIAVSVLLVGLTSWPFFYSFLGPYKTESLGRIKNVSVVSYDRAPQVLTTNAKKVLMGFIFFRGQDFAVGLNDRYVDTSRSILLPVTMLLFWLGFLISIKKRPLIVWWFLVLLLPIQIFSTGSPDISRSVHLWPVIYGFGLIGLWSITGLMTNHLWLKRGWAVLVAVCVLITVYLHLSHYFDWITSPSAINSRQPAIWRSEYQDWLEAMKTSVVETGYTYGVYQWREKTDQQQPLQL